MGAEGRKVSRLAAVMDAGKCEMCHYGPRVASVLLQRHRPVQLGTANLGNLDPGCPSVI